LAVESVNTAEARHGTVRARSACNALLEAAIAGWATTMRLAFLLVVRGAGWAAIAYAFHRSGLDVLL
jgi:hypothetical protein